MEKMQPIIIKKRGGHGGHHGGAWKVAYADFVTAMMALFIVLWLMNSSKEIQKAVSGYFKDPSGTADKMGSSHAGAGENLTITKDNIPELKEQLQKVIKQSINFDKLKDNIEMTITSEGLRIELLESASGTFFDIGSSKPTENGVELMTMLATELGTLPNKVSLEGHTDAKPYAGGRNYSNWELSADRANAARRLMQEKGLRPDQVSQVRGFADQRLRTPSNPLDPANRRISLIVQYLAQEDGKEQPPVAGQEKTEPTKEGESPTKPEETKPSAAHTE